VIGFHKAVAPEYVVPFTGVHPWYAAWLLSYVKTSQILETGCHDTR
jgi:hypothetical protein